MATPGQAAQPDSFDDQDPIRSIMGEWRRKIEQELDAALKTKFAELSHRVEMLKEACGNVATVAGTCRCTSLVHTTPSSDRNSVLGCRRGGAPRRRARAGLPPRAAQRLYAGHPHRDVCRHCRRGVNATRRSLMALKHDERYDDVSQLLNQKESFAKWGETGPSVYVRHNLRDYNIKQKQQEHTGGVGGRLCAG